jgi:uncharacterized membrane protein
MNNMVWLGLGSTLGLFTLTMQWWTINRLLSSESNRAVAVAVGGMIVRLALVAGLLIVALKENILAGILVLIGWWLVRSVSLVWVELNMR